MNTTLCIGLDAFDTEHAQWALFNADGSLHGSMSQGPLGQAAALSAAHKTIVIVKTLAATRTTTNLPVKGKKLAQALPFALEDQFAADVETLHFAAGDANDDGVRQVVAIEREKIETLVARLEQSGITATAVHTVHDALTPLEHFTQLLTIDGDVLLLDDDGIPAGFESISVADVISAWQATRAPAAEEDVAAAVTHTLRLYVDEQTTTNEAPLLATLAQQSPPADIKTLTHDWFAFCARSVVSRGGVNLLQGAFASRTDAMALFRPWMAAAAMLAAVTIVGATSWLLDYRALKSQSASLDTQIESVVSDLTSGRLSKTLSPERQLAQIVNSRRSSGTSTAATQGENAAQFLGTLNTFATAIATLPKTSVGAIAYRNGIFDIQLTAPNAGTLESLTKAMSNDGALSAKIQRTEQVDGGVKSFVQIQAAAK
ncbi:MAG: type II secretion system protein GspL [Pseudomonadota bacterium]